MTVLEAIQLSSDFLQKKGIVSPRLNAELLLSEILKVKRLDLYLKFDRPLTTEETNLYRDYIVRRSKYEPLQYITGNTEFYGLQFAVSPAVLIPRNDTEILVDEAIKLISNSEEKVRVLEVGSGSGNIAVSLAVNCPNAEINSIDISAEALEIAKKNANSNNVHDRINFICSDFFCYKPAINDFDFIISNPPYISKQDVEKLAKEITEHEPRQALTDENDGLSFYKAIINFGESFLKHGGRILFEVEDKKAESVTGLFAQKGFQNIYSVKDYSDIQRVVCGEKK